MFVAGEEMRGLTALRGRGEEADLDLLLAELVGELDDGVPGAFADRVAVGLEVVDEVYLAACVDGDLVAGADAEAGVVVRAKVHEALAGGGVGLLIEGAGNGEAGSDAGREGVGGDGAGKDGVVDVDGGGVGAGGDV